MTAEEFYKNYVNFDIVPFKDYNEKLIENDSKLAMIKFAQYHVEEALKEAQNYVDPDKLEYCDYYDYSKGVESVVNPNYQEILTCYSLENIK